MRVTHKQKVDAAPEKVWALVSSPAALTAMPGHHFAFAVPAAVPGANRLCCLIFAHMRHVHCALLDVQEQVPGQLICWQTRSTKLTGQLTLTLSVRPRRRGCTLGIAVRGADFWRRTTRGWGGNLRAIAEGAEPWPPDGMPADVSEACAGRPLPGTPVEAAGAVLIDAAADAVWEMVWAPETNRLKDPEGVAWAGHVPGTPQRAVGEMQCTVIRHPDSGFTAAVAVVKELTWGRRAVTQHVGPPWNEIHHVVTPADGGTRLLLTDRWPAGEFEQVAAAAQGTDGLARRMQANAEGYKKVIEERGSPSR